jgi:hypothetical protein
VKKKFILLIILSACNQLYGQTCWYFPGAGTVMEMQTFDEKGKLKLTNTSLVRAVEGEKVTIDAKLVDDKNKNVSAMTYDAVCKDGNVYIDGSAMVPPNMFEGKHDATVSVTGDKIIYPQNLDAGTNLPEANIEIKMEMQGMPFPFKSNVKILNRKVIGEEEINVPAGTFKCWKITYDVEYKVIIGFKGKATEWISPGKGFIKSEVYNKNGKLMGTTVRSK